MSQLTLRPTQSEHTLRDARLTRMLQHGIDLLILVASFLVAYALRFDFQVPPIEWLHLAIQLPYVVLLQLLAVRLSGIQAFIWRYIGMSEVAVFVRAACWSAVPLVALRIGLPEGAAGMRGPLSVMLIDTRL